MRVALIVAMAENGVIGRDNHLPWHLPEDLKYFRSTTMGKPVIMGRKTFESIGRPLPGRTNIVLSTRPGLVLPEGVHRVHSADEALSVAARACEAGGVDEAMVIGGEQVYALFMPEASRLYLTRVHAIVEGDAHFPGFHDSQWHVVERRDFPATDDNPYPYSFCVLERN